MKKVARSHANLEKPTWNIGRKNARSVAKGNWNDIKLPSSESLYLQKEIMNVCIKLRHAKHMPNRLLRDEEKLVVHRHSKYDFSNNRVHICVENLH